MQHGKETFQALESYLYMWKSLSGMVDAGLFVLIWIVQLIIYPSFGKIDQSAFIEWHRSYTMNITLVVAPLMFAQLGLSIYELWVTPTAFSWIRILMIGAVWVLTFFLAVPVHNSLDIEGNTPTLVQDLVRANWPRTAIWTLIFLLGLLRWR